MLEQSSAFEIISLAILAPASLRVILLFFSEGGDELCEKLSSLECELVEVKVKADSELNLV